MPFNDPLFAQGLVFTGTAILLMGGLAWWLYRSPMKQAVQRMAAPSTRLANWLAVLVGLSALQMVAGGMWDGSMHIQTGVVPGGADFLWPPHIMIYSSFLITLIVGTAAIATVAIPAWNAGVRDPRQWIRSNPYLGGLALACVYALASIPGDAIWHELFGIDLTAWSPPHVIIGAMQAIVLLCTIGLLSEAYKDRARPLHVEIIIAALLALLLNLAYLIGAIEWEMPGIRSPLVQARPIWAYPLVGGLLAFVVMTLAKRLIRFRWAATAAAIGFYLIRFAVSLLIGLTGNIMPFMPLWFIVGALLLDVVPWQRIRSAFLREAASAIVFTAGYTALALPLLSLRTNLPAFTGADYFWAVVATFGIGLIILLIIHWIGAQWIGRKPEVRASTP